MTLGDIRLIIKDLKNNKAAGGDIPLKLLKECDFTYEKLTNCINNSLSEGFFPDSLKRANITPVHKKNDSLDKENYRPLSILPLRSKVYERAIFNQLSEYMQKFLNKILCGFRKAHSSQHTLFRILQAWQKELDNSGNVCTIVKDLSKAYECIPHDLLTAKLEAHGLDKTSLNIFFDYLNNRKQRTKLAVLLALGMALLQEYHKDQFWDLYFLISSSMTYFFSKSNHKYVILLMTTHSTVAIKN